MGNSRSPGRCRDEKEEIFSKENVGNPEEICKLQLVKRRTSAPDKDDLACGHCSLPLAKRVVQPASGTAPTSSSRELEANTRPPVFPKVRLGALPVSKTTGPSLNVPVQLLCSTPTPLQEVCPGPQAPHASRACLLPS